MGSTEDHGRQPKIVLCVCVCLRVYSNFSGYLSITFMNVLFVIFFHLFSPLPLHTHTYTLQSTDKIGYIKICRHPVSMYLYIFLVSYSRVNYFFSIGKFISHLFFSLTFRIAGPNKGKITIRGKSQQKPIKVFCLFVAWSIGWMIVD